MPPETVEPFINTVGDSPATVRWDFAGWPEAPEVGLGEGGTRGAFVTLCVNVRDLDLAKYSTDHTVFVHVKQVKAERAPWLATQVGLSCDRRSGDGSVLSSCRAHARSSRGPISRRIASGRIATMSNSYAQPILRTPDLSEALRIVERLLGIADLRDLEIDFEALVSSADVLSPLLELLPHAKWYAEGDTGGSSVKGDDPSAHFPVRLRAFGRPPETVGPFLYVVGDSPATVRWDFMGWPEAPEVGLNVGGARGAFVTLCVNIRDLELEEPSTDHTVWVHVKQVEAERAPWLAAQVGLSVIGDLEMAPY